MTYAFQSFNHIEHKEAFGEVCLLDAVSIFVKVFIILSYGGVEGDTYVLERSHQLL